MNPISRLARLLAACIALFLSAQAATFTVITTDDTGPGSLRQAVADAANTLGGDTINFAAGLSGQTITLGSEMILDSSVTIEASSLPAGLTIDGGPGTNRIFYVNPGQTVTLKHLTLTGGNGDGANGMNEPGSGGAIFNYGTLTLTACTLLGNSCITGGAICSVGTLILTHCTLTGNSAINVGGAIFQGWQSWPLILTHCTLTGNSAINAGGGIFNDSGSTITNSIIAGNTRNYSQDDIFNAISIAFTGVNFIGNLSGSIPVLGPTILTDDPQLAPLGHYGGPTRTMPLKTGSPARNAAAVLSPAITADQRGFPLVGAPDIGAYEAGTFNSFATWSWEFAGSAPIFGNDNENDGAINGLEYATRRDPNASDVPLSPTLTPIELGGHTFHFRYQKDARDLRYIVQRSGDLGNANSWTEVYRYDTRIGQITENGVNGDENPATQVITLTDSTTGPLLFWRLVIEQLP